MFEEKENHFTPISALGEFGLIEKITRDFPQQAELLKGPGDDAAVYELRDGRCLVTTTDILAEGVHFDLSYTPMHHLGYKSVVVNLSDVYAMNANPFGIMVSIALSNRFTVEATEALYLGIRKACEKYNVVLMGGDTSSSKSGLVITVSALGFGEKEKIVFRSGAKDRDLICVSGDLGAAYAGLQILEREKRVFLANPEVQPQLDEFDYCVGRQLKPEARRDIISLFSELGIQPTSMMDISDGLANELHHICKQSNMGCVVYQEKLPIDFETSRIAEDFNISPVTYAMNGGEDYELLFTLPIQDFDKVKSKKEISIIGHITTPDRGIKLIGTAGMEMEIPSSGFNHFQ